ncbi:T9SS type A sorting domain-containing protein [Wenyingzhuangia sp. IMCC45467]
MIDNDLFIGLEDSNEITIEIFKEDGQLLIQKTVSKPQNSINSSNLPIGTYWVKLTSNKGITTKKVIKNL